MKTSPTPWKLEEDFAVWRIQDSDASDLTGLCVDVAEVFTEANAALIVEAVNAYEANKARIALLEGLLGECAPALRSATTVSWCAGQCYEIQSDSDDFDEIADRIDAALKGGSA